jgi:acetyl-CoA carboxylase biotin carboxylase subunit
MAECKLFKKILIANRGEIAVRVIRACKELGIPTVAVYSAADRAALQVRKADEAYCIGPPPSPRSYLLVDKILEVAKQAGCDAICPGYGFLSERADFAERCAQEQIAFIGPNPHALRVVADKISSRLKAVEAGVPVVPGMLEKLRDESHAKESAEKIGCPLMLKAVAGAGGRGMRKVGQPESLRNAFRAARSEARNCFGDGALYMECYIESPRHVEMQVLGDKHGAIIHCMERECSVQRRYQEVIEESPSTILDDDLRSRMGEAAVRIARAVHCDSAGTVEFLVSGKTREFFFLGMHTGLQTEHTVTEAILGIDICKEMIRIAAGQPISYRQDQIKIRGHAIECRIYAEDSEQDFVPSFGKIVELRVPGGAGVREESGIYQGLDVPIYYDPLLSKLVVWGSTREECIARSRQTLAEYVVKGIKTTIPFHERVLRNRCFITGEYDAALVDTMLSKPKAEREKPCADVALLAAVIKAFRRDREHASRQPGERGRVPGEPVSAWKLSGRITS